MLAFLLFIHKRGQRGVVGRPSALATFCFDANDEERLIGAVPSQRDQDELSGA